MRMSETRPPIPPEVADISKPASPTEKNNQAEEWFGELYSQQETLPSTQTLPHVVSHHAPELEQVVRGQAKDEEGRIIRIGGGSSDDPHPMDEESKYADLDENDLDQPSFLRRRGNRNRETSLTSPALQPTIPPIENVNRENETQPENTAPQNNPKDEEEAEYRGLISNDKFISDMLRRFGGLTPEEAKNEVNKLPSDSWKRAASVILGISPPELSRPTSSTTEDTGQKVEEKTVTLSRRLTPEEERQVNELSLDSDFIDEIEDRYGELPSINEKIDAISKFPDIQRLAAAVVLGLNVTRTVEPNEPGGGGGELPPAPPTAENSGDREGYPEDRNNLEYLASPERGKKIAEEIIKWEALRVSGKYKEVDWKRLDQLYQDQRIHVTAKRIVGLRFKPSEEIEQSEQKSQPLLKVEVGNLDLSRKLSEWLEAIRRDESLSYLDDDRFNQDLDAIFKEAKRIGLLKGLDEVLASVFNQEVLNGMRRGLNATEIMEGNQFARIEGIEQKIDSAVRSLNAVLRNRARTDLNIRQLIGVGEIYANLAKGRFHQFIQEGDIEAIPLDDAYEIPSEFKLGQVEGERATKENFWRHSQGYYIEIYAQTEEEFAVAAESYLNRLEALTSAPDKIFQKADQFIDVMMNSEGANKVPEQFLTKLADQIYARLGFFGADHANELYHSDQYKQYLDFINKDGKGPSRWLELYGFLDGEVAAATWMLDNDPRWEMLFALYGSRGQLARAAQAQRGKGEIGLFNQVKELLVEEIMGVRIKNKANVANLASNMTDKEFTGLFEGLYRYGKIPDGRSTGDANIEVFKKYGNINEKEIPREARQAWRMGKIQSALKQIEEDIEKGLIHNNEFARKFQEEKGRKFNPLKDKATDLLDQRDRQLYQEAHERAERAVEIALEIYGATGEKSKRGGGVFKVWKTDTEGKRYQDFVPIHLAEKFVQFAVTWTKAKYANAPAKIRTAKVDEARTRAIAEFKKHGYEAKLYDEDGRPMMIKRPKEDPRASDEIARDNTGKVIIEEAPVDFYLATHHFYGDWTSHTYWSYQEEDRQMLLDPSTFARARKIKAGELRPEDADPWAIQLLILDPTLRRVAKFPSDFEDRERKLTMAAVEDSYQTHWEISRELYRAFFPKYGTPAKDIGIYYGLQDYGGFRKSVESMRARYAEDPERFMRRGRRLLADLHNPIASLSEIWGQGTKGVTGVMRMFNSPVYSMAGSMALDKFSAQAEVAARIASALEGGKDREGNYDEGLLLKLTNNSDKLIEAIGKIPLKGSKWTSPKSQNEYCYAIMESLGREKRYLQLLTVMETQIRNASGAQWLKNVDILLGNGQINPEFERRLASLPDIENLELTAEELTRFIKEADVLEELTEEQFNQMFNEADIDEGSISTNTGSGRHSAKLIHNTFGELLVDPEKRGGQQLYKSERLPYSRIHDKIIIQSPTLNGGPIETDETIWDFVFGKFVPT